MKYYGFDGNLYSLNLASYQNSINVTANKSQYHIAARAVLREKFPLNPIYEEIPLPGSRENGSILYADFFLPTLNLLVEVHGEQHYSHTTFFHKSKADFLKAKARDAKKKEWCEINGFTFVELSYKETEDEWRQRLS